jgi:DNA-binding NarL/FixJ family response regulator
MEPTIPMPHDRSCPGDVIVLDRRAARTSGVIRVMLAYGEGLVRAGFRALLEAEADITVSGEASNGEEALALAGDLRPDVVLMDIRLLAVDALEATRRILARADLSHVKVLMLGASESDDDLFGALRAGASGFLVKESEPVDLLRAVRSVAEGDALVSPSATRRLIDEFAAQPHPQRPVPAEYEELTAREREVVALVAIGLTNGEIAERLVVSPATAKTHVSRAIGKLRARDRAQLVALAYQSGLVQPRRRGEHGLPGPAGFRSPPRRLLAA